MVEMIEKQPKDRNRVVGTKDGCDELGSKIMA